MKIFCAISTHWDREWYKPFQGFRYNLVKVTDNIIDALESGKMEVFTFDGQTIVLEDYLEIKPQNREKLKNLIKQGKLRVGPWYVMPDELLVSGESIIKNFLVGKAEAEKFGAEPWKYGYMNDIFGHIAQMPQILNGFGIKCAYMGRGLGAAEQNFKNFVWKSPDGSKCYGYKECYADLCRDFKKAGDKELFLKEYLDNNADETGAMILLYTDDHADIDEHALEFLKLREKLSGKHEVTEGLENIADALENISLPHETGELIKTAEIPGSFRAVTNSISSYYPLKYENDICENLLENKLSPMLSIAKMMGLEMEQSFYQLAAKYLLKNQPHDSICGCSSDVVHEDMMYRYSQVKSIAKAMSNDFEEKISGKDEKDFLISVLNYDAKKYQGVFITDILFDDSWENKMNDNARYQEYYGFDILDESGNKVPYQILGIEKNYYESERPYIGAKQKYRVAILSRLNAFGETVFKIIPEKANAYVKTLFDGELCAENKYIKLEVSTDGSVSITDKENKKTYKGLNTFIDDGEMGNGWFSERPLADNTMVSSKGAKTTIEVLRNGALVTTFRVTKWLYVPKSADYNKLTRSGERTELKIVTDITLKQDSKAVEFETVVDNCAKDHRLRMEFPTGIDGDNYYASQAFTFIKRGRGITEKGANSSEAEAYEKNTSGIICIKDENVGLSFVSKAGIHECGVSQSGVISATMLRSFGRIMWGNILNEKAQIQGMHTFRYALTTETDFTKLNDMKKTMFEIYQNVTSDKKGHSLLEVLGDISVSIVKPSENGKGIILRLYNPKETAVNCEIVLKTDISRVFKVNLAEEGHTELSNLSLEILPNKIETLFMEV